MSYAKKLAKLTDEIGSVAVDKLDEALVAQEASAKEPWQKALLALAVDGVQKFGPEGVKMASEALENLLEGKEGTKISDLTHDFRLASDLLAALQSAEAARKQKARSWLRLVGEIFAKITKGFVLGLL